ncbi:MAG: type II toxin-antitoxin system VapC family toxin [Bryobacteraceae bacterium]
MVLVDTSIWIRFLADRAPYAQELSNLLSVDEVAAHELVAGELLVGDRGGRHELLTAYDRIYRAWSVPHSEVIEFVRHRKLNGRGIRWIDVHLLASALVSRFRLWTADSRLHALASELGIAYRSV